MSPKRKPPKAKRQTQLPAEAPAAPAPASQLSVARHGPGEWKLVHPRCVREREEDMAEVRQMLEEGEVDVAVDELRWLLDDCGDLIEAHCLLGEIALGDGDLPLARGHFGYAFQLGRAAASSVVEGTLPYHLPENASLLEAAKGLAWCLHSLGRVKLALEVVQQALAWDPQDPLGIAPWLNQWQAE
ncbi:MAG TPA: hypothetical protein VHY20_08230 [Pirellulales bacterium]|nr:hypothetical protein [Pirellulales bacterium]